MNCAIGKNECLNDRCTCFNIKDVVEFVKLYNRHVSKSTLSCKNCIPIKKTQNLFYYLDKLKERVCEGNCSDISFIDKLIESGAMDRQTGDIVKTTAFKPLGPLTREWLSNIDIDNVLDQYQNHHTDFLYIDTTPIDFNPNTMFKIYRDSYKNKLGIRKIATVYNTDPSSKPGKHWIASFVDIKKKTVFFYDSVGSPPPKNIQKLLSKINNNLFQNKNKILWNNINHQKKNSECGVFCLYFITTLLDNKTNFATFCKDPLLTDDAVFQKRKIFFRKPEPK